MDTQIALNDLTSSSFSNLMIRNLSEKTLALLLPHMSEVALPHHFLLVSPGEPIRWNYFLTSGVASVTNLDAEGTAVEVGIIGREGVVGFQALLGGTQTANSVNMQAPGNGFRIKVEELQHVITQCDDLSRALDLFVYAMLEQTTRLVLCNRLHDLGSRLARWLLITGDCTGSLRFQLTQVFLAEMLGTSRPVVTVAAQALQQSGAITYSRGRVEILNRDGLQAAACECYQTIRQTYQRLYPDLY